MTAMNWLFKEEPTHYGYDSFAKDKRAVWSGVRNPVAQRHLHAVKKGDRIFYYHTGDEKAIVGVAKAAGNAYPDPDDPSGKAAVVDIDTGAKVEAAGHIEGNQSRRGIQGFSTRRASRVCR